MKNVFFPMLAAVAATMSTSCVSMSQPTVAFSYVLEDGTSVGVTFNTLASKASDKNPISGK